ncbi:MAG TPA: hypothetical protein VMN36_14725 [Verrucomicrobiales bacterium]|nr:hypothetical protein [Verrucomicrobiales bacterium]
MDSTFADGEILFLRGRAGEPEFEEPFRETARLWKEAALAGGAAFFEVLPDSEDQRDRFVQLLGERDAESPSPLWIVLAGHGTHNGRDARLNLEGPDLDAAELAPLLSRFRRPLILINGSSCSGPWISALSAPERILITATKSGLEVDYSRFGLFLAGCWAGGEADLDNDGQVTLLEAFLTGSRHTQDFYSREGRIATEQALLDDNGDGRGSTGEALWEVHVEGEEGTGELDGLGASQWALIPSEEERGLSPELRLQRNKLERDLFALRRSKKDLAEERYYERLEVVALALARLYEGESADPLEPPLEPIDSEKPATAVPEAPATPPVSRH